MGKSYDIYSLIHREWKILLSLFLIGLLFYIYPICHQAITIDNELHIINGTFEWYLMCKRWGIVIVQKLFFIRSFVPSFWIVVNVALLSLGTVFACSLFQFKKEWLKYLFGILVITFPQYSYMMKFACTADAVGIGFLLVTYGLWIFMRSNSWKANLAVLLLFIGTLSIYESLIFIPLSLFTLIGFSKITVNQTTTRTWFKSLIRLGILILVAYGLYQLISIGILCHYGLPTGTPPNRKLLIGWGNAPFDDTVTRLAKDIWLHLQGKSYYGESIFALFWIPLAIMIFQLLKQKHPLEKKLILFLLLLASVLAPFSQIFLLGRPQPPRVFFAQPFLFAGLWCMALRSLPRIKQEWAFTALFILFVHNGYRVTQSFHFNSIEESADNHLMQRIMSRLDALEIVPDEHKILIVGSINCFPDYPQNKNSYRTLSEGIGHAYFSQGQKNRARTQLNVHGYTRTLPQLPSWEQIHSLAPIIQQMPAYPAEGSIDIIDDVLIIKLSSNYNLEKQYKQYTP